MPCGTDDTSALGLLLTDLALCVEDDARRHTAVTMVHGMPTGCHRTRGIALFRRLLQVNGSRAATLQTHANWAKVPTQRSSTAMRTGAQTLSGNKAASRCAGRSVRSQDAAARQRTAAAALRGGFAPWRAPPADSVRLVWPVSQYVRYDGRERAGDRATQLHLESCCSL